MKPPVSVTVTTNNHDLCWICLTSDDGTSNTIQIAAAGNVYQGLHAAREPLEKAIAEILAAHGIVPARPAVAPDGTERMSRVTKTPPAHDTISKR